MADAGRLCPQFTKESNDSNVMKAGNCYLNFVALLKMILSPVWRFVKAKNFMSRMTADELCFCILTLF